jgi:predicted RNA-binding Zn-ribbon protein involved in translation (DUF1610 family)
MGLSGIDGMAAPNEPSDDSDVCRRCARCESVLHVTPQDELLCPRCGRVRVWTVSIHGRVMAAGRESLRGGIGIWLAGRIEDLRPANAREPARSRSGWNEES